MKEINTRITSIFVSIISNKGVFQKSMIDDKRFFQKYVVLVKYIWNPLVTFLHFLSQHKYSNDKTRKV